MLADIKDFISQKDFMKTRNKVKGVSDETLIKYWKKWLSPESLEKARIRRGVYHTVDLYNRLNQWSSYEVVDHFGGLGSSVEETMDLIEKGIPVTWWGRAITVDNILDYMAPVYQNTDRTFFLEVLRHEHRDERDYKQGYFIEKEEEIEDSNSPFWTWSMMEFR